MTKSSTKGIQAFKQARETQKEILLDKFKKLGVKEITTESKLEEAVNNPKIKPKRATLENVIQSQYYYIAENGYRVHIHMGMIGYDFSSSGAGWVLIINPEGKRIISWIFPRNFAHSLMFRIGAYAELAKRIIDSKPKDHSHLAEAKENSFVWRLDGNDKCINFQYYATYLPKKEKAYVIRRENQTEKWLNKNPDRIRRRKRRTVWKNFK